MSSLYFLLFISLSALVSIKNSYFCFSSIFDNVSITLTIRKTNFKFICFFFSNVQNSFLVLGDLEVIKDCEYGYISYTNGTDHMRCDFGSLFELGETILVNPDVAQFRGDFSSCFFSQVSIVF